MFPIKYIDNNLVWNKDNEVFAYYELIPYNYSFLSAEQKFIVHDSFRQLIAQSREGKIHALQIATESSIRSMQEQSKKLVTGKLKEVAYGNMFYVELVNQYLTVSQVSGELAQKVMNEALKYQGWKYVYGGSNPNTSFDCSGLTQWCYGKAGISLPRTAQAQYDATQHLPLSQAKAGDLVFFHSTYNAGSYVTHVGILVSPTQMYHAGNPIGYADLSSSYWQQHLIGAGRVKQ